MTGPNHPKDQKTGSHGLHEHEPRKQESNPEGAHQDQDPGHRQKQNQNDQREDPLAS